MEKSFSRILLFCFFVLLLSDFTKELKGFVQTCVQKSKIVKKNTKTLDFLD